MAKNTKQNHTREQIQQSEELVTSDTEIRKDIKGTGKFGLGHKKTKKASILYVLEDIGEALRKAKNWCVTNYRTSIPAAICTVLVIVVIVCLIRNAVIAHKEEAAQADAVTEETDGIVLPEEPLEENAYDFINQFVDQYYTACAEGDVDTYTAMRSYTDDTEKIRMQKKSEYIENYQDLICYTKAGPIENSYLVYVYYEVKFHDIETLAPGLNTLYLCTKDDGSLYVFSGDADESVTEYMQAVSTQEDVKDLFNKVQVNYNDAVDSDEALKTFLDELSVNLKNDVGEALAQAEVQNNTDASAETGTGEELPADENTEAAGDENSEGTPDAPEETAEAGGETQEEEPQQTTDTVRTIDTVNIRNSASADATKLGSAEAGDRFTRYEALENGWSRIDYNGTEAYIKTEYLEVVESASGTVTVLENVNVRAEASETADKLGIAYANSTLEIITKQDDGWTKVIYEGKTGYVKSDYVQ